MKTFQLFCLFLLVSSPLVQAQDTIKVQAFTWPMTQRADNFTFPNTPGETYRKIWMKYNMRCHDAAVGNGSVGCREWDYSCNTFVTDSSRMDSFVSMSPQHTVGGYTANGFNYSTTPTPYGQAFTLQNTSYTFGINPGQISFGSDIGQANPSVIPTFRYQAILPAALLPGLVAGDIKGMQLNCAPDQGTLRFFRIRMQNAPVSGLNPAKPLETGWKEVFFNHLIKNDASTRIQLPFYQPFTWNGTSDILIDISYTQNEPEVPISLQWQSLPTQTAIQTAAPLDHALFFHGRGLVVPPPAKMSQVTNEITVMFWTYGIPESMPANTQIIDGVDAQNQRQLNIHLPWSNSNVYWDCGNDGSGYDRINKACNTEDFEGKWNHWAFTKEASGNMKIYLNGQLWHSASGLTKPINVKSLVIGASIDQSNPFQGGINEMSIWKRALTLAEVQNWQYQKLQPTNPSFGDVLYYYPFDQGADVHTAYDAANNPADAPITNPSYRVIHGDQRTVAFASTDMSPTCKLWQGAVTTSNASYTSIDSSELQQSTTITTYAVVNQTLTPIGTAEVYPAGVLPVFNQLGAQVSSITTTNFTTLNSGTLTHYTRYPAKYELLSLVTPYGNGLNLGAAGKTFVFDVTDFAPILKGTKRISMEFGGQDQEEIDMEFIFVKGTPERDVLDIQQIWPQGRGQFTAVQTDAVFEPRTITLRPDASFYKIRAAITGHDQNGEFTPREHYLNINGGAQEFKFDVWKACGKNPIYPQGGTWIFDRAGWCPGMATDVHEFALNGLVQPGNSATFDYGVNGGTLASANYLVSNQLVSYGAYHNTTDAAIEAVMRPNNERVEFERINPTCSYPIVQVRNSGSSTISSIEFEYRVIGGYAKTFTWTGNIPASTTLEVSLPSSSPAFWTAGNGIFEVEIKKVNGVADQNAANNIGRTSYAQAKLFDYTQPMRLRLQTNAKAADNAYKIKDADGNTIITRSTLLNNTTYNETIDFPAGCYTLEFEDSGNDGLSFWFYPNNGSGSLAFQRNVSGTAWAPIHTFNSDFGAGVQFDFTVGAIVGVEEITTARSILVYPNPTTELLNIDLQGFDASELQIRLIDMMGKVVKEAMLTTQQTGTTTTTLALDCLPSGMYHLQCTDGVRTYTEQVVVVR